MGSRVFLCHTVFQPNRDETEIEYAFMMYLGIFLIALVAGTGVSQSSDPPPPTPPKAEQKNQADTKDKQQPPTPDQRGTENSPLFIKVIPPLTVEPPPAALAQHSNMYTSPEWWLVLVTLILAAITAILAGYTAKLWGATKSLAEEAKQTATRQASEMQKSLVISQESAATAKASVALAREEFLATHRPRVIVRSVRCGEAMGNVPEPPLQLDIIMANVGLTPAIILKISASLMHVPSGILPPGPPYAEHSATMITLNVGEPEPFSAFIRGDIVKEFDLADGFGNATTFFFCLGYLIYEDALNRRYRTAFVRRYNASIKRFSTVDDPEYEYQD